MTEIEYLGHSAFAIRDHGKEILIDPFLSDNPRAPASASEVRPDLILVTHAHHDHLGDALELSLRFGCPVLSVSEINDRLEEKGAKVLMGNIGGETRLPFCRVKIFPAVHSSSFEDGGYGGTPCSFLIHMSGRTVFHAGDTALFSDLSLVAEDAGIDVALLPVGDVFTMGLRDALKAMRLLRARTMVPMHYDTWPSIAVDRGELESAALDQRFSVKVLAPGERLSL
ncbi:MAG: metal-dependent hydrolase [Methanomassiliicoccales archaeon PtaB.Bin215]|nr:MAG: metal-dependent hydrolase [Methanomassiliicoccales archaeon PtaB.Bin215]